MWPVKTRHVIAHPQYQRRMLRKWVYDDANYKREAESIFLSAAAKRKPLFFGRFWAPSAFLKHFWICFRQLSRAKWTEEGATQLESCMIEKRAKIKSHSTQISSANWENELLGNRAGVIILHPLRLHFSLLIIIKRTIELVVLTTV